MKWEGFHHPDVSLPVLRRNVGLELLELMEGLGNVVTTRGFSWVLKAHCPSRKAYHMAVHRLRKRGLVARRSSGGAMHVLRLTDEGKASLSDIHRPQKFWRKKWNRIWYVLVYDVPEKHRHYRDSLRGFLSRLRMGCLQQSVWISPRDIRPEYADMVEASGVDEFSHLFEARTVLGRGPEEIVRSGWPFDRLECIQRRFCEVYESNCEKLLSQKVAPADVARLAAEEMRAYRIAMQDDPLLPSTLWPSGYLGEEVWRVHQRILREIGSHL